MRHVLLHGHIFKNAGSTLDWSLRRSFGAGFCEHRNDAAMREAPEDVLAEALEQEALVALSSHNLPSPPPYIPDVSFHSLFLLRDPVERVLSVYAFERAQRAQTPGAQAAKRLTLQDYVAWRLQDPVRPVIRNFQTRFLAGGAVRHASDPLSAVDVASARQRLAAGALVGIVERYDESMVVLEAALKPLFPHIDLACVPQNVGPEGAGGEKSVREQLGPLWQDAMAHNTHDLALYSLAVETLDGKIAALPHFERELNQFRQRSAALHG
ncbi:MAG: sulfotransferase family 2 domain-containing protein [Chromatocurvus sp.]